MRGRVQLALGLGLAALGVVVAMNARTTMQAFAVLIAVGLVATGILRVVGAVKSRAPSLDLSTGALMVALGLVALLWRQATLQALALLIAVALLVTGLVRLVDAIKGTRDDRLGAGLSGIAAGIVGGLVLVWPRLTLPVVGALCGTWLVFTGLEQTAFVVLQRWRGKTTAEDQRSRRWPRTLGAAVSLVLALLTLAGSAFLRAGDPRSVPDAFYLPPSDVPGEPGALIRREELAAGVPGGARGWRILYTTTQPDGSVAVASGTVLARADGPPGPRPVIAVAHGTTGIVPKCAPSLGEMPFGGGAGAALEQMVGRGWVGVISDYVGLGTEGPHPYLVGEAEARSVLDAVRAAHQLPELELDARTVVWGHSQGGHGALWTGSIAPQYAPEFELLGVAAMAPATDLYALAEGMKDSSIGKIVLAYVAASWSEVFPTLGLSELVTPGYASTIARLGELCFEGRDALAAVSVSTQLVDKIFSDEALHGPFGQLLRANSPTTLIATPLLIAQGDADRLVLPTMQERFVAERCAAGQPLDFRMYPGRDHMPLVAPDSPLTGELVVWTRDRLAGAAPTNSCPTSSASLPQGPIRPEPEALRRAPPELVARLRADAFTYFRFVNRPWAARVCAAFAADLKDLAVVRLHGDAHVEQFALTQDAWGLDDFDDAARGPALVDIIRYLGSVDLAARERGWRGEREALFGRFFEGYRRGLAQPDYRPPPPDIVRRLRAQAPGSRVSFLSWGEAQMQPMGDESEKAVVAGMEAFARVLHGERPELAPEYFRVSRAGWLRLGVGSAGGAKILLRVQGVSTDPADDELIEAKEIGYLGGLGCLEDSPSSPTLRVILGAKQLGRLKHHIVAAGPDLVIPELLVRGQQLQHWWVRSWDPTYREVRLIDLQSVNDLAELVYDAGVQLGGGSTQEQVDPQGASVQKKMLASITGLEPRLRQEATALIEDVLGGWQEFRSK